MSDAGMPVPAALALRPMPVALTLMPMPSYGKYFKCLPVVQSVFIEKCSKKFRAKGFRFDDF